MEPEWLHAEDRLNSCFGHDSSVYAKPDRKALRMTATELISPGGRLSELDHIDIVSGGER